MERESGPDMGGLLATDYAWTQRQRQVLGLVAEGKTNQEIADALGISLDGAKWHMREILSKLGVERREQAAEYWRERERWRRKAARFAKGLLVAPAARWLGAGAAVAVAIVGAVLLVALLRDGGSSSEVGAEVLENDGRAVPAFPAPGDLGLLAFIRGGNVWVKPVPDGPEVQLTDDGGYYGPSWSPSGEWLAVQRNPNVVFLGRDAQRFEARSGDRNDWRWSPVADRVAVVSLATNELIVVDPSLGNERIAWKPETGKLGSRMAWSPDGSSVAAGLQVQPPSTPLSKEDQGMRGTGEALVVVDLASGQASEVARSAYALGAFVPAEWPPPGDWVVVYERPDLSASLAADGLPVRAVRVDTGEVAELGTIALTGEEVIAAGPGSVAIVAGGGREALWNKRPWIAMLPGRGPASAGEPPGIPAGAVAAPSWSAGGGTLLAFVLGQEVRDAGSIPDALSAAHRRIWVYDTTNGTARQLTDDPAYRDEHPQWSTDGRHILFARVDEAALGSIWLADVNGGTSPRRVLGGVEPELNLGFSGYYGSVDWNQYYDWWQPGRPAWTRD